MKTYAEKLKDPRWQKKRLHIMERDGFECKSCLKSDKQLQIHHYFYLPNTPPWDYHDDALVTFCEDCHREITLRNADYMMQSKTPLEMLLNTHLLGLANESEKSFGIVTELAYALSQVNKESDYSVLKYVNQCLSEMIAKDEQEQQQ